MSVADRIALITYPALINKADFAQGARVFYKMLRATFTWSVRRLAWEGSLAASPSSLKDGLAIGLRS